MDRVPVPNFPGIIYIPDMLRFAEFQVLVYFLSISLRFAGILNNDPVNPDDPEDASGSSRISAKLFVPAGTFDHAERRRDIHIITCEPERDALPGFEC